MKPPSFSVVEPTKKMLLLRPAVKQPRLHLILTKQNIFLESPLTYIDDSVSVDEPHDPGLGVAGDPAAEAGAAPLRGRHRLGLRHEAGLELFCLLEIV